MIKQHAGAMLLHNLAHSAQLHVNPKLRCAPTCLWKNVLMAAPTSTGSSTTCGLSDTVRSCVGKQAAHCQAHTAANGSGACRASQCNTPARLQAEQSVEPPSPPATSHRPTCSVDTSSALASTGTSVPSSSCVSMGVATTAPSCAQGAKQTCSTGKALKCHAALLCWLEQRVPHPSPSLQLHFLSAHHGSYASPLSIRTVLAVVMATLSVTSARAR